MRSKVASVRRFSPLLAVLALFCATLPAVLHATSLQAQVDIQTRKSLVFTTTATQANSKLSIVNGTAFADFGSGANIARFVGGFYYIEVIDGASKVLAGYLKAAGTGETYGSSVIPNPGFEGAYVGGIAPNCTQQGTGTPTQSADVHGGSAAQQFASTSGSGVSGSGVYQTTSALTNGALYKFSGWFKRTVGAGSYTIYAGNSASANSASYAQLSEYWTSTTSGTGLVYYIGDNGVTFIVDDGSATTVNTPSATGATIISTVGGATQNWTSEANGFNRGSATGYTIKVYRIRRGPIHIGGLFRAPTDGSWRWN